MDNTDFKFVSKNIYIRSIRSEDANGPYVSWLNDSEINQYLESRFIKWDKSNTKEYIQQIIDNKNEEMFAICMKNDDSHIGNIKIGAINWHHQYGDIGIIIGDKNQWGKKRAQEAINLVCHFGFRELHLNKLTAGCYDENIGSLRAFEAVGFQQEGRAKKKYLFKDRYTDLILLGLLKEKYIKLNA